VPAHHRRLLPAEKRGGALGLIGAVFGLAFLIGPILGGIIMTFTVWQWLFIVNLPIAVVVIVLGLRLLPSSHPETRHAFDWPGCWCWVLCWPPWHTVQPDRHPEFLPQPGFVECGPFLGWRSSLLSSSPSLKGALKTRCYAFSYFKPPVCAGECIGSRRRPGRSRHGLHPSLALAAMPAIINKETSSYLLMPVVLAMAVGSPLVGRILDKLGSKLVVLAGSILTAIGMIMLGIPSITPCWRFSLSPVSSSAWASRRCWVRRFVTSC